MADKKLNIKVQTKGAKKSKKQLGGVEKAMGSLATKALAAGGAFFAAQGLIRGFKAVIDLAGKQEMAEKKLEAALGKTSNTLLKYASSLQEVSLFGDEATIEAMSMMAAFTKDEEALKKLTAATLDYAAATGTDLNAASQLVGRTFGTSMNAMSRYGVAVEGAAGSTERLESLTGNLAKMFGGQAKAQTETMEGSIVQMQNAIGDAGEVMGVLFAPAIIKMADGFKGAAEAVGEYITQLRLSNTALADVVDTDKRILVLEAKMIETKKAMAIFDDGSVAGSVLLAEKKEELIDLEEQLEFERMKSDISEQKRQELAATQAILDKNKEMQEEMKNLAALQDESDEPEMLGDIALTEKEIAAQRETNAQIHQKLSDDRKKRLAAELSATEQFFGVKKKLTNKDIANAMKSASTFQSGVEGTIRSLIMEAMAAHLAGIFKSVPFPFNLILAAGAGGAVNELMSAAFAQVKAPTSFAQGGQFVTSGAEAIVVGDNPSGRERVTVEPLGGDPGFSAGGVNITFNSPVMSEDYTEQTIIPQIKEAIRRGADIGVS